MAQKLIPEETVETDCRLKNQPIFAENISKEE